MTNVPESVTKVANDSRYELIKSYEPGPISQNGEIYERELTS